MYVGGVAASESLTKPLPKETSWVYRRIAVNPSLILRAAADFSASVFSILSLHVEVLAFVFHSVSSSTYLSYLLVWFSFRFSCLFAACSLIFGLFASHARAGSCSSIVCGGTARRSISRHWGGRVVCHEHCFSIHCEELHVFPPNSCYGCSAGHACELPTSWWRFHDAFEDAGLSTSFVY